MRLIIIFLVYIHALETYAVYTSDHHSADPSSAAFAGISFKSHHLKSPIATDISDTNSAYISYSNDYMLPELSLWQASISFNTHFANIAGNLSHFGYEMYNETAITICLAKQLSEKLTLGFNARYSTIYYEGCDRLPSLLATDLGAKYEFSEKFTSYLTAINVAHSMINFEKTKLERPSIVLVGYSLKISNNVDWSTEVAMSDFDKYVLKSGLEYAIESLAFKFGLSCLPLSPSFGVGFSSKWLTIDVATRYHNTLGYSLTIGLGKKF